VGERRDSRNAARAPGSNANAHQGKDGLTSSPSGPGPPARLHEDHHHPEKKKKIKSAHLAGRCRKVTGGTAICRPCGLHGVKHGSIQLKRRLEPLIAHVNQLVWFRPYRLNRRIGLVLVWIKAPAAALRPSAAPQRGGGEVPGFSEQLLVRPCCTRRPSSSTQHPTQRAPLPETWW